MHRRVLCWLGALTLAAACRAHTAVDIDRNNYPTLSLGGQEWLGANLRATRAPNGAALRTFPPNGDPRLAAPYGLLYDWASAKRACMAGWRLPTDEDWTRLAGALGAGRGGALKDTAGWRPPNAGATNRSGFAAHASGYWNGGAFDNLFGRVAVYWSATAADTHFVWTRTLKSEDDSLHRVTQHPNYGFSVRCVRD